MTSQADVDATRKAREFDAKPLNQELCLVAAEVLKAGVLQGTAAAVLDFGCGTGMLAQQIADSCSLVLGVDNSPAMLRGFEEKAAAASGHKLRCVCLDLIDERSLRAANNPADPFPEQFDLVVSTMTLHHIDDIPATLRILVSHLKPGGKMAIFDLAKTEQSGRFHTAGPGHGIYHRGGFTEEQFRSYLTGAGLEEISCRVVHRFTKPAGDNPQEDVEHGMIMGVGTFRRGS